VSAFFWGREADLVQEAVRTMRWWHDVQPVGPWVFIPTTGFGPNLTWGVQVPVLVVLQGARVEEPEVVRLARRTLGELPGA